MGAQLRNIFQGSLAIVCASQSAYIKTKVAPRSVESYAITRHSLEDAHRHIACDHGHISREALEADKMLFSSKRLSPGHRVEKHSPDSHHAKETQMQSLRPQPHVHVGQKLPGVGEL